MEPSFNEFCSWGQTENRGFFPAWATTTKKTKKNKNRQQQSSFASQGVADGAKAVRWEEKGVKAERRLFFPLKPIWFLEMLLSFNKSLIRRITHNPPAAARWLQLKKACPVHFYPTSTFGRHLEFTHFKPSPQPNNSITPPSVRDKARSKALRGACDELAQIVRKRLVCLGYLEVFLFPLTEWYQLFKVIISFTKSLSRIQLLWEIWGEGNKSQCNSTDGPSAWCINISKTI